MSSALLATLFAILGTGLAATSAFCLVLWRRVGALTSAARSSPEVRPSVLVALPSLANGSSDAADKRLARARSEVSRRLDEMASRHRALEARLARVEASTTEAAIAIPSHPGGPRKGRRVDRAAPGGPTLIAVPNLAAPPSPSSEAAAELDRRFGDVWAMADAGDPVEAIARETGYPIGQVELILGLRRQLLVTEAGPDA